MFDILDEAYQRLHGTGPEWGDGLSNHGPMAAEVMVRRGYADEVTAWVDAYLGRLDKLPAAADRITDQTWPEALGDGNRIGDWTAYLTAKDREEPWRDVLTAWWPRLLPGIIAGATHVAILVAPTVRTLLSGDDIQSTITDLSHGHDLT